MFLRADLNPARQLVVAGLDKEREIELLRHGSAWELVHAGHVGVPRETALVHRVAISAAGQDTSTATRPPEPGQVAGNRWVSDTEELEWDARAPKRGRVTLNGARSKAVIGFGAGQRFDLAGVVIEPGPRKQGGWSAITVTAIEGDFRRAPCRVLVTATGYVENTRMGWKNPEKSSVGKDWGEAPTLVEGIPARLTLPFPAEAVTAWSLDERGQRKARLATVAGAAGNAVVVIGPEQQTIWYEMVVK